MSKTVDFVKKYLKGALDTELKHGFPTSFILAQAALETGWGASAIGFNIFGITAGKYWKGKTKLVSTFEYLDTKTAFFDGVTYPGIPYYSKRYGRTRYSYPDVKRKFRDYDNAADCFEDHFKILNQDHFRHALQYKNDGCKYAHALQSGKYKYATAEGYAGEICKIITMIDRIIIDNKLMAICK